MSAIWFINRSDGSLWGMQHRNGLSHIVRLEAPFREGKVLHTFPYATDFYDLDLSPDGAQLTGALVDESGTQRLVRFQTVDLLAGKASPEVLQDFQFNSPGSFTFSPDARYLYGSSYYTGASNLFRFDLKTRKLEALSNTETGLFRPLLLPDGTLAAYEYSAQGFRLVKLPVRVVEDVNAIPYLGQSVVDKYPELKSWKLPSRDTINDLEMRTYAGAYRPLRQMRLYSMYPIVQGYQNTPAGGLRFDFGDGLGLSRVTATVSYSPDGSLALRDRLHVGLQASYWDWRLAAYFNKADFYDLFGPTKVGRRGFGLLGEKTKNLVYDSKRRLDLTLSLAGFSGLDRLPDYQNVIASHSRFLTGTAALAYSDFRKSLGGIEDEAGQGWNLNTQVHYTFPKAFPHAWGGYDRGFLLPLRNSSLWVRSSAGAAFGAANDPFRSFFFGGFGNNWIDRQQDEAGRHVSAADTSRYREYFSFPGVHLNQIGGTKLRQVPGGIGSAAGALSKSGVHQVVLQLGEAGALLGRPGHQPGQHRAARLRGRRCANRFPARLVHLHQVDLLGRVRCRARPHRAYRNRVHGIAETPLSASRTSPHAGQVTWIQKDLGLFHVIFIPRSWHGPPVRAVVPAL